MRRLKLFVLFFMLAVVGHSYANEMMDRVNVCGRIAMGALLKKQGFGPSVSWISHQKMAEFNSMAPGTLPKDHMFVRDDGETDAEKHTYSMDLIKGWELQDSYMKAHKGTPKDEKEVLELCMQQKDAEGWDWWPDPKASFVKACSEAEVNSFLKTASSQGLAEKKMAADNECDFRAEVLVRALKFKGGFDSVDQMLEHYPFPDAWSAEFQATAKQDITNLFNHPGNSVEFIKHFVAICKAHSDL